MGWGRGTVGGHRAWRITGTLAMALTMAFGAVQTWGLVVQQERTYYRTYPVAATRVHLDTGTAAVRIRPGEPGRVVVTQWLDWTVRRPRVETLVVGDVVTVRMRCNQVLPVVDVGCGALIELDVPAGVSVDGGATSGSVDVAGLSGDVRLDASSGAIELSGLSGQVYARTTSGMVKGTGLGSGRVDVNATSGAVELGFARPPHVVSVGATSGSVSVTLPHGSGYNFAVDHGSGDVHVDTGLSDPASPDTVQISTTSGAVNVVPAQG
ncbi:MULTISPECIES: DUF4097 family beta strand repeat-containing protein [unclassified Kitasatospora]|uniref:DUF4097 family beta strand repeat-containing protein n=1 Tax=unclassified Kitasatospora TaxID=2633591 RepID=UPI001ADF6FA5|nr:DUF4097 family beta strand repeat-containing protein [Kitasatospora sp. RG8]MBP0451714.1 DUF4097 family beta strand repeat protein [Kitasatospora sp. RG8]